MTTSMSVCLSAVFTKSMYSCPTISSSPMNSLCSHHETSVVCYKHAFICLDSSSLVVRVLHFNASSFCLVLYHLCIVYQASLRKFSQGRAKGEGSSVNTKEFGGWSEQILSQVELRWAVV